MPLIWLRVATFLYGLGLLHSFLQLGRRGERLYRVVLPAMLLGAVLHAVALVETVVLGGLDSLLNAHQAESLLALLILLAFLAQYTRYRTPTPGIYLFPLVFVLNLSASIGTAVTAPGISRAGWVGVHVVSVLIGMAALFLSFVSSLLYLSQSRAIKSKRGSARLMPSLAETEERGHLALRLGFPFITFGLITGMVLAQMRYGMGSYADPRVLISWLMWGAYLLLLYVREALGWRGRKVVWVASLAVLCALMAFVINVMAPARQFGAS
jgi:ABC-type uncharacterized transport system permease subunit